MSIKADLSEYTIRIPTPAQEEEYWRATFVPWGKGKTWDDFKAIQLKVKALGSWTDDGAVCQWVLVRRDDLDGTIYAGCETFRRKSFLKNPGEDTIQEVYSYGIASVICPTKFHRNGYPTRLLSLLHYYIAPSLTLPPFPTSQRGPPPPPLSPQDQARLPPGIASILFSDVGSVFYSKATIGSDKPGWIVRDEDNQQISWKISSQNPSKPAGVEWIYARDLSSISEKLSNATRKRLSKEYSDSKHPVWTPDPASTGTLSYIPYLSMSVRPESWEETLKDEPCGIRIPPSKAGEEETIVLFAVSVGNGTPVGRALLITYIHNLDIGKLPILLESLDVAAGKIGVEEGWVWGVQPSSELGEAWIGQEGREVKSGRRDEVGGHLLGVAWYGDSKERGEMVDTQMWSWC